MFMRFLNLNEEKYMYGTTLPLLLASSSSREVALDHLAASAYMFKI